MCKEYKRKYQEYKIIITYLNGDTEELNYKGINTSSYKDMINLYTDVKEKYSDESVIIDFVGQTESGKLEVMWKKKIINKDVEIKEKAKEITNTSVEEILKNLINNFELLNNRFNYSTEQINILNKKQDVELHKIESISEDITDNLKLLIIDQLHQIRKDRRKFKNECKYIKELFTFLTDKNINLKYTKDLLQQFLNEQENKPMKKYDVLTDKKAEELKIMKKVTYRNFKERVRLIAKLEKEFEKVYYDNSTMEIICYNKAKAV